jgi:hypothetical protein
MFNIMMTKTFVFISCLALGYTLFQISVLEKSNVVAQSPPLVIPSQGKNLSATYNTNTSAKPTMLLIPEQSNVVLTSKPCIV